MGIFSTIVDKIFHHQAAAQGAGQGAGQTPQQPAQPAAAAPAQPAAPQAAPAQPAPAVDVEAVLSGMAEEKGGGGNWRSSIVDLLKLLDMDSSLQARKQLADEVGVHVGADGTAEENIALHQAVMRKLEENGGRVPDSLKGH